MARGRERTAAADPREALEAFTEALRARPGDAHAWAELGYAALLAGEDAGPALRHARMLTHDRALLAQVWFNEALFRERRGDAEGARLALVIAEANGSSAATRRLGTASRCAATWATTGPSATGAAPSRDAIVLACSWREILAVPTLCRSDGAPGALSEAEAKRAVCVGCVWAGDEGNVPGTVDLCQGPGPWTIPEGYFQYRGDFQFVQPLPDGRFYVAPSWGLDDPDERLERSGDAFGLKGSGHDYGMGEEIRLSEPGEPRITYEDVWSDDPRGGAADGAAACKPAVDGADGFEMAFCAGECNRPVFPSFGPRELRYYALGGCGPDDAGRESPGHARRPPHAGALRLTLSVWTGDVKATIRGSVATISGGGCDATVPLPW